ncbi:hypothetical protein N7468_000008 [Penicillium chermesinum]|uniref:Uncharacterized protein n=1 Tax=Penicillium chermesinum TaxID=63820 RepID=A0A9W9TY20_9EURO|nr:uncharacterized protein N7468_000008 [Penicillium chermesinum]KAJ5248557.1 hypothetical protein N7468_000008 [Penicillium chermesinum]
MKDEGWVVLPAAFSAHAPIYASGSGQGVGKDHYHQLKFTHQYWYLYGQCRRSKSRARNMIPVRWLHEISAEMVSAGLMVAPL